MRVGGEPGGSFLHGLALAAPATTISPAPRGGTSVTPPRGRRGCLSAWRTTPDQSQEASGAHDAKNQIHREEVQIMTTSPDKWPKGGASPNRMHIVLYRNAKGAERINSIIGMDQARAIAAGDEAAGTALLEAIADKVTRLERGWVTK